MYLESRKDGIVGNASVIIDKQTLIDVWINGATHITSVMNFDESYVQLFDDLDALGYLEVYSENSALSGEQKKALREYIETFRDFDDGIFVEDGILNVDTMLSSEAWYELEAKARRLVFLFLNK